MNNFIAHCPDDQHLIEELCKEIKKLREELDEYKVRHPKNTGIKNGAPFFFKPENKRDKEEEKKRP